MLLAILLVSCSDGDSGPAEAYEGDAAGECDNGADDDRDGFFDCDDNGCMGSSVCAGSEADADTDADSDSDTDSDSDSDSDADTDSDSDADSDSDTEPSPLAQIGTIDLTYDVSFDIVDPTTEKLLCGAYGICDCAMTFEAQGAKPSYAKGGDHTTLAGTWERTVSNCSESFEGAIWVDTDDPTAWVSLVFSDPSCLWLDAWVAHGDPADWEPLDDSPGKNEQFYVRDMNLIWKAGATGFEYHDESSDFSAGFELAVTNDVDATITK